MSDSDRLGTARRRALTVVTGTYRHDLPSLASPGKDAEVARRVLSHPDLGRFESVDTLLNVDMRSTMSRIYDFFAAAEPDEFLFAYFSCHGRRDGPGRLYLTTIDTEPDRLPATAIPADTIGEWADFSRARDVVVVFDCCHAAAYGREPRRRGDRNRVVLLAAGRTELAHEGEALEAEPRPSAFASAFFEGIETGRADVDDNGWITVREAFDYARLRVQERQNPEMRAGTSGDVMLSRAPQAPGRLPSDLASLVRNGLPAARRLAVEQLGRWLTSGDPAKMEIAERTLAVLRSDPDERVARSAGQTLARRYTGGRSVRPLAELSGLESEADPLWFRRAVYYEIQIRSFADSSGDGIGDLTGLRDRLSYLQTLGVDCLILSPLFDSPLEDDGYDVSDFRAVHSDLGGVGDLVELVDAAHQRGIRIVLDLVLNHTSKRHHWFEASRTDPDGQYGDFYVWRDNPDEFADAVSPRSSKRRNWSYDWVRKQYYYHRFAPHEPDLNFDSPAVQDAIGDVLRFWLDRGVAGFRLLTAPYLYERDGTASDGLDETHRYLHRLRSEVDSHYRNRLLMARADRWPADAAEYFGTEAAPECSVVLFSSLMPRIFLGMRREDHRPVSAVLAEAQDIPSNCQWGMYLRNSDEMALDLISERDREYLEREYAPSPRARTPFGIRRRLAPLLDGDRGQLELCMALLLSLPGAPVLYYGDEIGMGENLSLRGCSAIRTPMQWSSDRGAGFSTAEPEQLTLPVVLDSMYGYQATNVAAQLRNPTSLLQRTRRLIEIRRHSTALSVGSYAPIASSSPAILAYLRADGADIMLCVANFSRFPDATELDLSEYSGKRPVEATGGARFPVIGAVPYRLSLAGHGFFWLRLVDDQGGALTGVPRSGTPVR
jgi:trehalose synthase